MKKIAVAAMIALAAMMAACGKQQQPKVDPAAERAAAHDRASKDAFSAQVNAVDKAHALEADVLKKAEERGAAADEAAK